ncbi:hypothetical protein FSP39_001938 [Pinctada imbricata]|uniref:Uncharacterized protein n=1 Tax=Pinctada imbricata TaxID=66713 RepID=A0AA89BVH1_PINIB|nr:hypothetical protein FSP39_001938 [Pinctada imbricata]
MSSVAKTGLACGSILSKALSPRGSRASKHLPCLSQKKFSLSSRSCTVYHSHLPDLDLEVKPLAEYMFPRLEKFGDKVAMVDFPTGRSYTYKQMVDFSRRVASALTRKGYKKGDVIALNSVNLPEFTILMLAAGSIGVIVTTSNPAYTSGELSRHLEHSGAKHVFTIPQLVPLAKDAISNNQNLQGLQQLVPLARDATSNNQNLQGLQQFVPLARDAISNNQNLQGLQQKITVFGECEGCEPFKVLMGDDGKAFPENIDINPKEDVFVIPYSSGTTGLPKGVMLTHDNVVANLQQFQPVIHVTPDDNALGVLPFFHIYGMSPVMLGVLQDGGQLITLPKFDPEQFLTALQQYKVSQLHIVPPIVLFLAKHPVVSKFDLSNLNTMISGAAPLGEGVTNEVMSRLNCVVRQGYGLTETSPVVHIDTDPCHPGTIGKLIPNTIARLVDPESGKDVAKGEPGELIVQGPQIMKGYLKNQKATDEMIVDGWLHTGDVALVNDNDCFMITDRLKELIKYKGYQVAPAELEDLILKHNAVQDVAVIGLPDEEAGEVPMAFVVKKPGQDVSEHEVQQFVEGKAAHYKRLKGGVKFVGEIPKSPSGKILRRILKESIPKAT